jgi:hypothetical protein
MKSAVQLALHRVMPPGELLTVPLPVPMLVTVSETVMGGGVKVADTFWAAFITMTQVLIPLHPPDQPVKVEPAVPLAVRVTELPTANSVLQVLPQLMPGGLLVMMPLPSLLIVNCTRADGGGLVPGDAGVEELSDPAHADNKRNRIHALERGGRWYICYPSRNQNSVQLIGGAERSRTATHRVAICALDAQVRRP